MRRPTTIQENIMSIGQFKLRPASAAQLQHAAPMRASEDALLEDMELLQEIADQEFQRDVRDRMRNRGRLSVADFD